MKPCYLKPLSNFKQNHKINKKAEQMAKINATNEPSLNVLNFSKISLKCVENK